MHAAAARYVSVSELYSTDEVELLLDEIRDLEPTSCPGEDIQDFEIAGSGLGAAGSGARSPAGTERSWDSHAHYRRAPPPPPRPLAPVYCRLRHLATLQGAFMFAILLCSLGCASCVWAGAGLQTWALPTPGRVRLLQLGAITSALLHASLLLLRVSGLDALLPLRWDKLGLAAHAWSGSTLLVGGAGSLHSLLLPEYRPAPTSLLALLYTASLNIDCGPVKNDGTLGHGDDCAARVLLEQRLLELAGGDYEADRCFGVPSVGRPVPGGRRLRGRGRAAGGRRRRGLRGRRAAGRAAHSHAARRAALRAARLALHRCGGQRNPGRAAAVERRAQHHAVRAARLGCLCPRSASGG